MTVLLTLCQCVTSIPIYLGRKQVL